MCRAIISPILRSVRLCLQLVVQSTDDAACRKYCRCFILTKIKIKLTFYIGHILLRNCLLKCVIEKHIVGTRRQGKRSKQLINDRNERIRFWKFELPVAALTTE